MDEHTLVAEGLSRSLLDEVGADVPVDLRAVSDHLGLSLRAGTVDALVCGSVLFDAKKARPRQRIRIAHELGHALAARHGEDDRDESLAWKIGAAILIPAQSLKRELDARRWDLRGLPRLYGVSWEVLARRLCFVAGAVVSIWDQRRLTRRWRSPWLRSSGWSRRSVPAWEAALSSRCSEEERYTHERGASAYWVPSRGFRRVVVVTDVESWEGLTLERGD